MDKITNKYALYNGDCVEVLSQMPDEFSHLTISSFPFGDLFTYSDDVRDFSNVSNLTQYFRQLRFLIKELYRTTVKGRLVCVHLKQLAEFKGRDGHIGLIDFRGMMIRAFQRGGFIYHNEIGIWTDPQIEATRTKASTILYKTYRTQAEATRVGMGDYVLVFRKWTDEETEHVTHEHTTETFKKWTELASPFWYNVERTNVLNAKLARSEQDEKHMTPLQLGLIEDLIEWYSNEGETVVDPFNGSGSVVYSAIKLKRKGVGIELKEAYHNLAITFCDEIANDNQMSLFE